MEFTCGSAPLPSASAAPAASRFRSFEQMVEAAGEEDLVCLQFINAADKTALYAHRSFLKCCSKVLKCLIDDLATAGSSGEQQRAKALKATEDSSPASTATVNAAPNCNANVPVIPIPDEDASAWEDALGMVYPLTPVTEVGWDNAKRLLLLADKYDCPFITERVEAFLLHKENSFSKTKLYNHLKADTAFDWLLTFSKCNLDELAKLCITYITDNIASLPTGFFSSGLQPTYIELLCTALQKSNATLRARVSTLSSDLASSKYSACQPLYPSKYCSNCRCAWYCPPNSTTAAAHCVKCGIAKQRGLS